MVPSWLQLIQDHLKEMFPIIYTPTEGEAISDFSRIFRRAEGCFLNIHDQDRVESSLAKFGRSDDIDLIVVSDGEEILGIGDQGVGGILISIAKIVIYTLCAGVHPDRAIPVVLDCGTDNQELLNDDLYLGLRRPRIRGKEYDQFVERFVSAAREQYPSAYIHFEDFGRENARRILETYSKRVACFNDDVQGTGCVTLAAIMAGMQVAKLNWADLRLVMFGSGSAGTGIADEVTHAITLETGKSEQEARRQIWCVDKPGLLLKSLGDELGPGQEPYARKDSEWEGKDAKDLLNVIKEVKPHVLVGTSTKSRAFTQEVVEEMAKHVDRPIIFPLSNPTRLHEAEPKDVLGGQRGEHSSAPGVPSRPWNTRG